jgi:serine protease AprX
MALMSLSWGWVQRVEGTRFTTVRPSVPLVVGGPVTSAPGRMSRMKLPVRGSPSEGSSAPGPRRIRGAAPLLAVALVALPVQPVSSRGTIDPAPVERPARLVPVILREAQPRTHQAERVVRDLGGVLVQPLPIVGGFSARVPAASFSALERAPAILEVWPDSPVGMADLNDDDPGDDAELDDYDDWDPNRVWPAAIRLPADDVEGEGVAVALIDTGVTRGNDLGDRLLVRVDLTPDGHGYDRYGHGTHMAGIVAGDGASSGGRWAGVAPEAEIVSVKVAGWDGATDVSAVIAALQWVVSHRARYGIRVLNLSFGTDSVQGYAVDPLNLAVERAWAAGILVVVAAGNGGPEPGSIAKPADDPYVLTVGAADVRGTATPRDDAVAEFSALGPTGDGLDKPDLLAPGITIVSNSAPGSTVHQFRPEARVGTRYFKGSGTSQAAAIVSGVAALLFEADPSLSPDEAKSVLISTANPTLEGRPGAGAGLVDAAAAIRAVASGGGEHRPQCCVPSSSGRGSLEASRGTAHVYADPDSNGIPEEIRGELDVLGGRWDGPSWSSSEWTEDAWKDTSWAAVAAVGRGRNPAPPPRRRWAGMGAGPDSWSARNWSEAGWTARNWGARNWSAELWN